MWSLIDKEMTLADCTIYCWAPPDEPFDGEEGSIWSLNYFFFNKERKRVAYIYVRGVPVITHSQRQRIGIAKRGASGYESSANKRARYWLGDQAANVLDEDDGTWNNDVDIEDVDVSFDGDDGFYDDDDYDDEADDESDEQNHKGPVRALSEDVAAQMDIS